MSPVSFRDPIRRSRSILTICILCVSTFLYAGELNVSWDQTTVRLSPGPRQDKVEGRFTFSNKGKDPVIVKKVKATCGCTAVETEDKDKYAAGETGHIDFTISFSRTGGTVRKYIYVTISDRKISETKKLTAVVDAPRYVNIRPSILFWRQNSDNPPAKTATFLVEADTPIHITHIRKTGDAEAFTVKKRIVENGREYGISLQPRTGTERSRITLDIQTDFPSGDDPLTYKLSGSVIPRMGQPGSRVHRTRPGFLAWLFPEEQWTQKYIVLGLSVLGGISIALLVFAVAGKSHHSGKDQEDSDPDE